MVNLSPNGLVPMPLVFPSLSYDRAAIMRYAWAEFRGPFNKRGTRSFKPFGHFLTMAWRVARNVRARMADGSIERARAERAARETFRQQLWASLTDDQRAAQDAWLIQQCSTDGRSINSPLYR